MKKGLNQGLYWGGLVGSLCDDEWWIDHLEGEYETDMISDIDILLQNSPADRKRLEKLVKTRTLVQESDDVLLPEDGHLYDRLHDSIMAAIESESAAGACPSENAERASEEGAWPQSFWSGLWRRWVASDGGVKSI